MGAFSELKTKLIIKSAGYFPRPGVLPAAVLAASGALCASIWACGGAPWYVAVAILLLLAVTQGRRGAATVLCAALVALSAAVRSGFDADFGDRAVHGTATVCADDTGVSSLPELDGGRRPVRVKILEFTDGGGQVVKPFAGGRARLILPAGARVPVYGTLLRVSGRLIPGGGTGLDRRGRNAMLAADTLEPAVRAVTCRGFFIDLRDRMLKKLFSGVADPETRRLAAALFCGVASGVPRELRSRFSAAGMIHIFSVSGMHIAVLAFALGFLLRFLPFKARYPVQMLAVWLYILGTGAGTPAVRAGAMVSLWCVLRMRLLKLPGFDILCWTLALLLVCDPFLAASPGAQYSFLITGALLLLAAAQERRKADSVGEGDYVPACFRTRRFGRPASALSYLFLGALTAFLASAAVTLDLGRTPLAPLTILANVLIGLLMPGYFALFFLQLAAGLCGFGTATAPLFEAAFAVLEHIAEATATFSPALVGPTPPRPVAFVYALALLIFLGATSRLVRRSAAAVLALAIAWWLYLANGASPAVLVVSTGYNRAAAVAVADTGGRRAVLVNCPDRDSALLAAEFFRDHGIAEVDVLGDSGGDRGISALSMPVRRLRDHRKRAAARRTEHAPRVESPRLHHDTYELTPLENGSRLEYFDPGSKLCFGLEIVDGDRGREVCLSHRDKTVRVVLPWSTDTEVFEYEFAR